MTLATVADTIEHRAAAYAALPVFTAFRDDVIDVERFPRFLKEQAMAARWFQDLIWALTDIPEGPLAAFAAAHGKADSGHHKWMAHDLAAFGLGGMSEDDWFAFDKLHSRVQLSRILARSHQATDDERLVMLCCLEAAGEVTLGTLNAYVHRHGLLQQTHYLGDAHVRVEERQAQAIAEAVAPAMASTSSDLLDLVDLVFDALSRMFTDGGLRHYPELLSPQLQVGGAA